MLVMLNHDIDQNFFITSVRTPTKSDMSVKGNLLVLNIEKCSGKNSFARSRFSNHIFTDLPLALGSLSSVLGSFLGNCFHYSGKDS